MVLGLGILVVLGGIIIIKDITSKEREVISDSHEINDISSFSTTEVNNKMMFGANVWGWISPEETNKIENVGTFYDILSSAAGEDDDYYQTIQKLDSYNANNQYFMYKTIACNLDDYAYYHGSCNTDIATLHPDWMLHKGIGNSRISDSTYVCDPYQDDKEWEERVCYMDISNPEVRQYMINVYLKELEEHKVFDGLWVDIAPSDLDYYSGPTDKIKTDEEAFNSYKLYLKETKEALNAHGYKLIGAWSEMSQEGNNWNLLLPYVDGVFEEAFYYDWDSNKRPQAEIDKQIEDCKETVRQEKIYMANILSENSEEKVTEAYDYLKENCGTKNIVLFVGDYNLDVNNDNIDTLKNLN